MKENKNPDQRSINKDNFLEIKGISEALNKALTNLGVSGYDDLARYTPEKLSSLLKPAIPWIYPRYFERWDILGQARDLARARSNSEKAKAVRDRQKAAEQEATPAPTTEWEELDNFMVMFGYAIGSKGEKHFQTKVYHSDPGDEELWDGLASDELLTWVFNRAKLPQSVKAKARSEIKRAATNATPDQLVSETVSASIELSDLRVYQAKTTVAFGGRLQPEVLRAESSLKLVGADAAELTEERASYSVDMYLFDFETKSSESVGSYSDQLRPGQTSYKIQKDFPIPATGQYQLYVSARLLPPAVGATHLQGPRIRVEP